MVEKLLVALPRFRRRQSDVLTSDDGQAVTEYGVILGVLIVALAATVLAPNTGIGTFPGKVTTALSNLI